MIIRASHAVTLDEDNWQNAYEEIINTKSVDSVWKRVGEVITDFSHTEMYFWRKSKIKTEAVSILSTEFIEQSLKIQLIDKKLPV